MFPSRKRSSVGRQNSSFSSVLLPSSLAYCRPLCRSVEPPPSQEAAQRIESMASQGFFRYGWHLTDLLWFHYYFLRRTVVSISVQNQHLKIIETVCKLDCCFSHLWKRLLSVSDNRKDYPSSSYLGLFKAMTASSDVVTEASYFQPVLPGDCAKGNNAVLPMTSWCRFRDHRKESRVQYTMDLPSTCDGRRFP